MRTLHIGRSESSAILGCPISDSRCGDYEITEYQSFLDIEENLIRRHKELACSENQKILANSFARAAQECKPNRIKWYGWADPVQAYHDLVRHGWPDGVRQALSALQDFDMPTIRTIRRRLAWQDQGDELDSQQVYAGNLDRAWTTVTRAAAPGTVRNVIIFCKLTVNSNISSADYFWNGAVVIKLIDTLQKAGRNVKVIGYSAAIDWSIRKELKERRYTLVSTYLLKDWSDPPALDWIAGVVMTPLFFRYVGFMHIASRQERINTMLGRARVIPERLVMTPNAHEKVVHVADLFSKSAAGDFLKNIALEFIA